MNVAKNNYHNNLANYFGIKTDPKRDRSWITMNVRGFYELPFQLISSNQEFQLIKILSDIGFIVGKANLGAIFDLLDDFTAASLNITHENNGYIRFLQLKQIIHYEADHLSRYPECSLQQILLGIHALVNPDKELEAQAKIIEESHKKSGSLKVWSLVPEHRNLSVTLLPVKAGLIPENLCTTTHGILLRYKGGKWSELSKEFKKINEGHTIAAYCTKIAHLGDTTVLTSANIAIIWDSWPNGDSKTYRFQSPITSIACNNNGKYLSIGGLNGEFQVLDLKDINLNPVLSGKVESSIINTWFITNQTVQFISSHGDLIKVSEEGNWKDLKIIKTGRNCRLTCWAGNEKVCIVNDRELLECFKGDGNLMWGIQFSKRTYSLATKFINDGIINTVLVGLQDGTLQEVDTVRGEMGKVTNVSQTPIKTIEYHPILETAICCDSEGKVLIASETQTVDLYFRSWPTCWRIEAARWNINEQFFEALTPTGECYAIQRVVRNGIEEWNVMKLTAIGGPLNIDRAFMLSNGMVLTLNRESDESQIWLHRRHGTTLLKSRRIWSGISEHSINVPSIIHTMDISTCEKYIAIASHITHKKTPLAIGRLRWIWTKLHWQPQEYEIREVVMSKNMKALVITRDRGNSANRPPARIMKCGKYTHKLLDDGWKISLVGREQGAASALYGTAISQDGKTILAIDTNHDLWYFAFNPNLPYKPPQGYMRLHDVVACSLTNSGKLCAVIQTDQAVVVYKVLSDGIMIKVATILPHGQLSFFKIFDEGKQLILAGQGFISVISFSV